jgi:hypothetical protein
MVMSRHQSAGHNHNLLIVKGILKMTKFKYLVTTATKDICIHK